jgi:hypothetical protein
MTSSNVLGPAKEKLNHLGRSEEDVKDAVKRSDNLPTAEWMIMLLIYVCCVAMAKMK